MSYTASGNFIFDCLVGPCDEGDPIVYVSAISGIDITDAADQQILVYNETTGNWENEYPDQLLIRVYNDENTQIDKGDAVYTTGHHTTNNEIKIERAQANSESTMPCIGVAYDDIPSKTEGLVLVKGRLDDISLPGGSYNVGEVVYVSPTSVGALTHTKPTDPTHLIQSVGTVIKTGNNGILFVDKQAVTNDVPNVSSVESSDDIDFFYVQNNTVFSRADISTCVSALTSGDFENGGVLFWKGNPTTGQIDFGTSIVPGSPGANAQLTWDNSNQQPKWTPQPAFPSSPATNETLVFNGLSYESAPYYYPSYQSRANGNIQNLNAANVALNIQTLEASAGTDLDWDIANRSRLEILTTGDYRISCSIYGETTTQRANIIVQMRANGTTFFGPKGAGGYIRAQSNHNEASVHISSFVYPLTAGDYIEVVSNIGGAAGNWDTTVGTSNLTVEKLR